MEYYTNSKKSRNKKPDSFTNSDNTFYNSNHPEPDYNSEPIYSSNKHSKPKAIITLNIGDSLEQLKIYEGQDLYEIAADFANKHDLTEDFIEFLIENIQNQMLEHDRKSKSSFLSNFDNPKTNENPIKSEREAHYENWQKIMKERIDNKPQLAKKNTDKVSPLRQRSVSPIKGPTNITEKLFNESKILKNKQMKSEKIKEESELKNCSFRPKINDKSKRIIERDKSNKSIHEKLYEETSFIKEKKEKERKEEFSRNYTFKPAVSPIKLNNRTNQKSQKELTARLVNSKKESDKTLYIMKKKDLIENNFTPNITKDKYYQKVKEKEELELQNSQILITPQEKVQQPPKPIENPNKLNNNNIFDEYLTIIKGLFNSMDDDKDGVISSDKIDLSKVDPGFLEIIQEILLKVDEEKSWLDLPRFLNEIEENHLEVKIHNVYTF